MYSSPQFDLMLSKLDKTLMPEHIAVIMDGNRRWAKERNLPAAIGHREGEKAFHKLVEVASDIGIKVLTAYAFSVENWKRSTEEVGILMHLFEFYMKEERKYLIQNKIKFRIIGDKSPLPASLIKEFVKTEELTKDFTGMTLNLAVNYGSRMEIITAVRDLAGMVKNGQLKTEEIDEVVISEHLMTRGQKDPDLLIRTSGEMRISNFLLWQCAYSEFFFTEAYWPEFTPELFLTAIGEYQRRNRRFGGS